MVITIPQKSDKKLVQDNRSEFFGNIKALWNIDLSDVGRIKVSPLLKTLFDTSDDASFKYPVSFTRTSADLSSKIWAVTDGGMYVGSSLGFAADAIANTPSTDQFYSDSCEFESSLIVTTETNVAKLTSGTWTKRWWTTATGSGGLGQSALNSNYHPVHTSFNNLLLIGDGNVVHSVDKYNNVTLNRLNFPAEFVVMGIKSNSSTVFVITYNKQVRDAKMFVWDGKSENYTNEHKVGHPRCLSIAINTSGVPVVVNGAGELLKYNGAGFDQLAVFPTFIEDVDIGSTDYKSITARGVHPNGMQIDNDRILILVAGGSNGWGYILTEYMNSGVWEYNETNGLYHRYSLSKTRTTTVDFGSPQIQQAGALFVDKKDAGFIFAGAKMTKDRGLTDVHSLHILDTADTIAKRGYYLTPFIDSQQVKELWKNILMKFPYFVNSTDRVVVKFRIAKSTTLPYVTPQASGITWASTSSFTSTSAGWSGAVAGDEVEIVEGTGSGSTAHISTITLATGTYTVVLDEAISGVTIGDKGLCRINNFTKLDTLSDTTVLYKSIPISNGSISPVPGTKIQFKIELRGTGSSPIIEETTVISSVENKYDE